MPLASARKTRTLVPQTCVTGVPRWAGSTIEDLNTRD